MTSKEEFVNKHPDLVNVIAFAFEKFEDQKVIENYIKAYITTKQLLEERNEKEI
ncbi:hypothetical protein LCGC14_0586220 [marine sediment metagenome]|uniref:Uncharacterized protein n=1 Tax=marine sediment metagenome TaxID=412755 RepID=A0A0F9U0Z2_9ZZZZ